MGICTLPLTHFTNSGIAVGGCTLIISSIQSVVGRASIINKELSKGGVVEISLFDGLKIVISVALIILVFSALNDPDPFIRFWYYIFPSLKKKKEELRRLQEAEDKEFRNRIEKEEHLKSFKIYVEEAFRVNFDTIKERGTQDEIVRTVNYLGRKAAQSCMLQSLNLETNQYDQDVIRNKERWSDARSLAIKACPELAERMPYFGEFEPLKSHVAEHFVPMSK